MPGATSAYSKTWATGVHRHRTPKRWGRTTSLLTLFADTSSHCRRPTKRKNINNISLLISITFSSKLYLASLRASPPPSSSSFLLCLIKTSSKNTTQSSRFLVEKAKTGAVLSGRLLHQTLFVQFRSRGRPRPSVMCQS